MKKLSFVLLTILFPYIVTSKLKAQDTLIINDNYKWRTGGKLIGERSGYYSFASDDYPVYSGGIQLIYNFLNSNSSLESGIYISKRAMYHYYIYPAKFNYLNIPINYRLETKIIYVSSGLYLDYLAGYKIKPLTDGNTYVFEEKNNLFHLGYNLNLGFEKILSQYINIFVEGRYASNITSHAKIVSFKGNGFTNFGIAFGANYKFLK
jgi:hypothetical protein